LKHLKNPKFRIYLAWVLLIASLIGWPVSALTFAQEEPMAILGLSWFAVTLTALDILLTADTRNEVDK
jgi:uncharacterized membrane protein YfcA